MQGSSSNINDSSSLKIVSWVTQNNTKPNKVAQVTKKKPIPHKPSAKYNLPSLFRCVTDVLFNTDNIPDHISATYSDDYDILHVHDVVICKLNHEKNDLPSFYQQRDEIEKRLKFQLKVVERRKLENQLNSLNAKINLIITESRLKTYLEESKNLLAEYQRIGPIMHVKSFLTEEKVDEVKEEDPQQEERLRIIQQYLKVAKKYITLNVVRLIPNDRTCPGCNKDLVLLDPKDHSLEYCQECGFERHNFFKPSFSKENNGQNKSTSNSDYEDRENFIKAFECYLGEQPPPPQALFDALDEWASKYSYPSKEEIRGLPLNEDGTRGEFGKSMLLQALADEGLADYYKAVKLIGHLQWDWKLPCISQQDRDLIIHDYDETQKIFNAIPKERKSSMNTQLRLYRHLEARKIPCRSTDFKLPTTPAILEEQDNYWREMVKVIPGAEFTSLK